MYLTPLPPIAFFRPPSIVITIDSEADDESENDAMSVEELPKRKRSPTKKSPVKSKPGVTLTVTSGPDKGKVYTITETATVTIGRGPKSTFQLPDNTEASLSHCSVTFNDNSKVLSLRVKDLKSSNGTYLNGKVIEAKTGVQAFIGSVIRVGESLLTIGAKR